MYSLRFCKSHRRNHGVGGAKVSRCTLLFGENFFKTVFYLFGYVAGNISGLKWLRYKVKLTIATGKNSYAVGNMIQHDNSMALCRLNW